MDGFLKGCGGLILGFFVLLLVVGGSYAVAAANLEWWLPWREDKKTEIVRNTNSYVNTQQDIISGALVEFDKAERNIEFYKATPAMQSTVKEMERGQQSQVQRMCDAANRIDDQYVSREAIELMQQVGCWQPDSEGGSS